MKITFVTDTYSPQPNGVATTLQNLAKALRKLGHRVEVIRPSALDCDEEGLRVPSFSLPGYRQIQVGAPMQFGLRSRWQSNRPDVIYVATETPLGVSAINAARALGIPCASGFHTNFQQYLAHYQIPFLERATLSYLRLVHNRTSSTFVPSYDVIEQLGNNGFKNLELLPKGVDTEQFSPERRDVFLRSQWGATSSSLVGLYVGRIAPEKNLPLAVRAFKAIKAIIPDFVGVFVGDGPRLEALRAEHPEFVFAGVQRGEALGKYYASCDLFVFPSLTETFGNVTIEAMASGLAVLAFDYAAVKQHIVNGENGFAVPYGDEEAFVKRACEVAATGNLSQVRERARISALKLDWEKVAIQFCRNLVEMIEKSGRRDSSPKTAPSDGEALISVTQA